MGERFGESEIQNLYVSVKSDHDVGGLQITVDDAFLVRFFERLGYLTRQLTSFLHRDWPPLQAGRKVFSFHELEHEKRADLRFLEPVNRSDMRVIQRRQNLRLTPKAREPLGTFRDLSGKHFDRHLPAKLRIPRPIDFAHTASPKRRHDRVRTQIRSSCESHSRRRF